jgi:Transcriptional regulator, AbiEi antitoxin
MTSSNPALESPLDFPTKIRHMCHHILICGVFCLELRVKENPEDIFRFHGGQLRMSEAIECGITRYMLYSLRDRGVIEQVSRGIYRLCKDNGDVYENMLFYLNTM